MPCGREYLKLTFGTADGEELGRKVMGVDRAYRHHYVAGADIELGHKRFLNPELFESYLSATLYLLLEFSNSMSEPMLHPRPKSNPIMSTTWGRSMRPCPLASR